MLYNAYFFYETESALFCMYKVLKRNQGIPFVSKGIFNFIGYSLKYRSIAIFND